MSKKLTLAIAKTFAPEWATHVTIAHTHDSCIFESEEYYQACTPDGFLANKLEQGSFTVMITAKLLKDIT